MKWEINHFGFWLGKTKTNSTIRRKIFVTCTAGTKKHPILLYFLRTLVARLHMGDPLLPSSPMFIVPLKPRSAVKISFLPLAYSDIVAADKIRTQKLGLNDVAFRSHLYDASCFV